MARTEKEVPALVRAAEALEAELVRLEALSRSVRKLRLDTEKNISRAAKELNEALGLPERLAEGLRGLAAAMTDMQERQKAALEPLGECAANVESRTRRLGEHMEAFRALGAAAARATAILQEQTPDREALLERVGTELAATADNAKALFDAARSDDFPEVAREADALRQSLSAAGRRLHKK